MQPHPTTRHTPTPDLLPRVRILQLGGGTVEMPIYESAYQFVLGFGAGAGLCVYVGGLVLKKHEERHKAHEDKISNHDKRIGDCESGLSALRSAHEERGKNCRRG